MEANNFMQRVGQWPAQTKSYFEDLQSEMRRVTWPSWKQVRATTVVVILTSVFFGLYLFGVDILLSNAVQWVFRRFGTA